MSWRSLVLAGAFFLLCFSFLVGGFGLVIRLQGEEPPLPITSEPDYNMVGSMGVHEDEFVRLTVDPLNVAEPVPHFSQEFEVVNKTDANRSAWVAYVFDDALKAGVLELWQPEYFEWVEHSFECPDDENHSLGYALNRFEGERNPHFAWCTASNQLDFDGQPVPDYNVFEGAFKSGDLPTRTIQYDVLHRFGGRWLDRTQQVSHYHVPAGKPRHADRHAYYTTNSFTVEAGETIKWKINYKPATSSGKWDLVLWSGSEWGCLFEDSCDYVQVFDPTWLSGGWDYRKRIQIDDANVDSDLTDFPLLVDLDDDSDLISNALADGNDLRFTTDDGETVLSYEREEYAVSGSDLNALIWVKVPTIHSTFDTNIYVYYGNSGAADGEDAANVWDGDFVGVWHMNENSGNYNYDSASYLDANGWGDIPNATPGRVGFAQNFDSTSDYSHDNWTSSMRITGDMTVSFWVKKHDYGSAYYQSPISNYGISAGYEGFKIHTRYGGGFIYTYPYARYSQETLETNSDNGDNKNAWHHFSIVRDFTNDELEWWRNAVSDGNKSLDGTSSYTGQDIRPDLYFNQMQGSSYRAQMGPVDEVRISDIARSDAWIKFEHANMASVDNELAVQAQAAADEGIDFSIAMPTTCTDGKGATTGTNCDRVWFDFDANSEGFPIFIFDVNADGQKIDQGFFNITNNGSNPIDINMSLETPPPTGLSTETDTDNNPTGSTTLDTTQQTIITSLASDENQMAWIWGTANNYSDSENLLTTRTLDVNANE